MFAVLGIISDLVELILLPCVERFSCYWDRKSCIVQYCNSVNVLCTLISYSICMGL